MSRMIFLLPCVLVLGCIQDTSGNTVPEQTPEVITVEKAAVSYKVVEPEMIGESTKPHPAVVLLTAILGPNRSVGTAFFASYRNRKFLITAKHCVINANTLSALSGAYGPVSFKALSHAFGNRVDIAAFMVESESPVQFLELESKDIVKTVPKNDIVAGIPDSWTPLECVIYGYPSDQGFRVSTGKITHRIDFTTCSYLVCTSRSTNGMSGSPWVNKKTGKVVAVHSSTLGQEKTQRSGGISVEALYPLLDSLIEKEK